jgi:hypothetical protein
VVTSRISSEVLSDPVGVVVQLVCTADTTLPPETVTGIVANIAGGRAKQRRLAQALLDRPAVLHDGRSPGPRAIADLLLALRAAGAVSVSAPVCAGCPKQLRTLQRLGEDWWCGPCAKRPEPCSACGQLRKVSFRDRKGQPRCEQCPSRERDPAELAIDVVAAVDPAVTAETVTGALHAAARQRRQYYQIAWAIEDRPELLTGGGAEAPEAGVLRFIDALLAAGATKVVRPACPGCARVIALHRRIRGKWLCRNCVAKSRAVACAACGVIREPCARNEHGQPLCPNCFIRDPANQETCVGCQRRLPVSVRTPDGPMCPNCRPWKTVTCSICGKTGPGMITKSTGQPCCPACKQRWARCTRCGQVRPTRGGTIDEPLCATCTRPDPTFWSTCPGCGQTGRVHAGQRVRCSRCAVLKRLHDVLSDSEGQIRPELQMLHQTLASTDRPSTIDTWLRRSEAPKILQSLAGQPLTHEVLDQLTPIKPVNHLRSVLVAIGALPERDEHMARLEHWINTTLAARADTSEQYLLNRYGRWHHTRRLRSRVGTAKTTTANQFNHVKLHIQAAIGFLDWLHSCGLTLATAQQSDLDIWIASGAATHRREAGNFVRWANKNNLTSLEMPAIRWDGPTRTIDTEARWERARWLLHDTTLNLQDRVAGLLLLLYAQTAATISRLTIDRVHITGDEVRVQLGRESVALPTPLADLVQQLAANRHGHATIAAPMTSQWLFPGGQPGKPISTYQLNKRLSDLGLQPGQSRSTALFDLATQLPAAVLARMLGIHISVAVAWQRASSGDWMTYAAEVSRRTGR